MCLVINHVSKRWDVQTVALNNVSVHIKKNEFVCLLGPSGCGKTTLLKIIAGILKPDNGEVQCIEEHDADMKHKTGMVFQEPPLYPWKNVAENIEAGLLFRKTDKQLRRQIINEKLQLTGLSDFDDYYPHQLSGGMKQKTQLAMVLALNPDIVLLDEPFAAMDEILKHKFDQYLLELWQKEQKTFILVTHSIEEALMLSDRIILMKPNPGEIHKEIEINMPHPRDLFSPEYIELRKKLRYELSKFY